MIYERRARLYCSEDISNIENYDKAIADKTRSEFGKLFKETYGINRCDNIKLYTREWAYYKNHNKLKGVK